MQLIEKDFKESKWQFEEVVGNAFQIWKNFIFYLAKHKRTLYKLWLPLLYNITLHAVPSGGFVASNTRFFVRERIRNKNRIELNLTDLSC